MSQLQRVTNRGKRKRYISKPIVKIQPISQLEAYCEAKIKLFCQDFCKRYGSVMSKLSHE